MICPSCHEKITSLKAVYTVIADAYLDDDGKIKINTKQCKNELDEPVAFNKKMPSYYCWNCGYYFTHYDTLAETIIKEGKYRSFAEFVLKEVKEQKVKDKKQQ